jgi:hypothetical protein
MPLTVRTTDKAVRSISIIHKHIYPSCTLLSRKAQIISDLYNVQLRADASPNTLVNKNPEAPADSDPHFSRQPKAVKPRQLI